MNCAKVIVLGLGAILLLVGAAVAEDSLNVTLVGQLSLYGEIVDVAVSGNYAFIAAGYEGLYVINITNPFAPVEVGNYNTPGWSRAVAVSGYYAYVADEGAGLRIISISNSSSPMEVGYYETPDAAMDVAVAGIYAYVTDWTAGLRVINVSHPSLPTEEGFCSLPDWAYGVAVAGNCAYVADCYSGLRIVNVSNPAAPMEVGYYDTPGVAFGVAVSGTFGYVANQCNGLRIIDVSLPSTPMEVGYGSTLGAATGIVVSGNYAYVSDQGSGLRVFNVSNPSAPVEVGYYTSDWAYDVEVAENFAYVADDECLSIFDCSACLNLSQLMISLSSWVNPPFEIPSGGGNFRYVISVHNFTSTQQIFDAWIMVKFPDNTWHGPLLGPINLTLPSGASLARQRTQKVPGYAPAGDYLYEGRLGNYPDSIWAADSFLFTKLPAAGECDVVGDWSNTGESFETANDEFITHNSSFITSIRPNPFNPITAISFELRATSFVKLAVYDISGRLVTTLVDGWREAATHEVMFDGANLPSGIYLAKVTTNGGSQTQKLVLIK